MTKRPATARKAAARRPGSTRKLRELCPPIEVCGQSYRVVEDNSLPEDGAMFRTDCSIALLTRHEDGTPIARPFVEDTLFHEVLHAVLYASGIGWELRSRLGMSKRRWDAFEEDLVRLLTPALLDTLRRNGMLVLPGLRAGPGIPGSKSCRTRGPKRS